MQVLVVSLPVWPQILPEYKVRMIVEMISWLEVIHLQVFFTALKASIFQIQIILRFQVPVVGQ